MEPTTNPTEKTHQTPLQTNDPSHSDTFTVQTQNESLEKQQVLSEVFSLEQSPAEIERLKLKQQNESKLQLEF